MSDGADDSSLPDDASDGIAQSHAVAIFPLPNAVLFPGTLMPLHVFEPRYVEMTRDVLAGSKLLAVPRLKPGFETDTSETPAVFKTAGLGRILDSRELPDGRFHILVQGEARVSLTREVPSERSYRIAEISPLKDSPVVAKSAPSSVLSEQIVALCDQLSRHLEVGGDELRKLARITRDPGILSDRLAAALVHDADERQALLAELDPVARAESVSDHLESLLLRAGPRSSLPN